MNKDDLPPSSTLEDMSFAAELGRSVTGAVFMAIFFAAAGILFWLLKALGS